MKLKNISLFKREAKTPNQPSHDIIASDESYGNKTTVGAMWLKVAQDKDGNDYKFLSGGLSKPRTHEGKEYDGYVIITEKEWNEYQSLKGTNQKPVEVGGYNGEVNTNEIDF
jgi:hypothetical protein